MDYKEFAEQMVDEINAQLNEEEQASYALADGNVKEDSIVIKMREKGVMLGAAVESLYKAHYAGASVKELACDMLKAKKECQTLKGLGKVKMLENYDAVKEDLFVRAVNAKRNPSVLERGIYKQTGDMVLGVYLRVDESEGRICTTMVDRIYLDKWGLSGETVVERALSNTMRTDPPRIYNSTHLLLSAMTGEWDGISLENFSCDDMEDVGFCFLSTNKKTNGAAAIFYPGVLRRICEKLSTPAVYVVPTSIHDVAIHDSIYVYDERDLLTIAEMVKEQSTPERDILSDHIFKYELQTDEITEVM